jgi:ankyrin repeat protein
MQVNGIFEQAFSGNVGSVLLALSDGESVDITDSYGNTPLHWACKGNQLDVVRALKQEGASCVVTNTAGSSALHWAAYQGSEDLLKFLLENMECNPNVQNDDKETPLHWGM